MSRTTKQNAATSRSTEFINATSADRLICFREVHALLGMKCKTGHTARALAARGQIRAVRINERVVRYSEKSVRELIAGKVSA